MQRIACNGRLSGLPKEVADKNGSSFFAKRFAFVVSLFGKE
jgi:hypothetical protein